MYAYTDGSNLNGLQLAKALSVHPTLINGLSRGIKLKPEKALSKKRPSKPTLADKRREAKQKVNMGWEALIRTMPMQKPGARKNPETEALWENARRRGTSRSQHASIYADNHPAQGFRSNQHRITSACNQRRWKHRNGMIL